MSVDFIWLSCPPHLAFPHPQPLSLNPPLPYSPLQWLEGWSSKGMRTIADAKCQEMLNASQDVTIARQLSKKASGKESVPDLDVMGSMVTMHSMMGKWQGGCMPRCSECLIRAPSKSQGGCLLPCSECTVGLPP